MQMRKEYPMKKTLKSLKTVFLRKWSPAEKALLLLNVFLIGVLLGWITAPLKKIMINANCEMEDEEDE